MAELTPRQIEALNRIKEFDLEEFEASLARFQVEEVAPGVYSPIEPPEEIVEPATPKRGTSKEWKEHFPNYTYEEAVKLVETLKESDPDNYRYLSGLIKKYGKPAQPPKKETVKRDPKYGTSTRVEFPKRRKWSKKEWEARFEKRGPAKVKEVEPGVYSLTYGEPEVDEAGRPKPSLPFWEDVVSDVLKGKAPEGVQPPSSPKRTYSLQQDIELLKKRIDEATGEEKNRLRLQLVWALTAPPPVSEEGKPKPKSAMEEKIKEQRAYASLPPEERLKIINEEIANTTRYLAQLQRAVEEIEKMPEPELVDYEVEIIEEMPTIKEGEAQYIVIPAIKKVVRRKGLPE